MTMTPSKLTRLALAGFTGLTLCATAAAAQSGLPLTDSSYPISIGIGGGFVVPTADAKNAFQNGVTSQAFVLVHLGALPALRFNLGYEKFNYKEALGLSAGHTNILSGTGGFS